MYYLSNDSTVLIITVTIVFPPLHNIGLLILHVHVETGYTYHSDDNYHVYTQYYAKQFFIHKLACLA